LDTLPTTLDDVTPEWLTAFLAPRWPGVEVRKIRLVNKTLGTATRVGLVCDYAPGRDAGLPSRLYLKSFLIDAEADGVEKAPLSMFQCEVNFYRHMREHLELETPRIYGCELDEASGQFVVVMEDLLAKDARFGIATRPYTVEEVAAVADTVAELHAGYWARPRLTEEFSWLDTHLRGPNVEYFRRLGSQLLEQEYRLSPYKTKIFDPVQYTPERLWSALWKLQEINESQPPTVLHGDVHVGNTYVTLEGAGGLLDWQLMRIGCWAHDLTYLIVTALLPEERRRHERDLVEHYRAALARKGITPPGSEEAWLLHRQNAVWGVLMWLLTPTPLYDIERLTRLLERHRAAIDELDSLKALGF
jgi:aminoglycoside/choline kinase family phosphotransferase